MIPKAQLQIINARQRFIDVFGLAPNVLLVAANAELALNEHGIKIGATFNGMQIMSADISEDFSVGLFLLDQ